jgi:signal transduction histidine kinase/CheY-like chemotaxis protein
MAPVALNERHGLLERLARIHRSISEGAPLPEVLTAVAAGAADLLGDPVAGLRVAAGDGRTTLLATAGLTAEQAWAVREGFAGQGAGGRAMTEDRVVGVCGHDGVVDDVATFLEGARQSALAAPVRAQGRVVGSLTVATPEPGRGYGPLEHELLAALAEHAGLALLEAGAIAAPDPAPPADEPVLDARLRQAQALESAAALAGNLAADLNRVLAVVLGNAALLESRQLDAIGEQSVGALSQAAEQGAALAHRLGQLGRTDEGEPELVDAAAVVVAAARQAARAAGDEVELDLRPGARELPVWIDPTRARHALLAIAENAVEALGGRGLLVVTAEADDGHAVLQVSDDGPGMVPGVHARALEPGYGTRGRAGLGLAIAHRTVRRAGGRLELRSGEGAGTTVRIALPLAAGVPERARAPEAPDVVVLAADGAVLDLARRALSEAGHSVLATTSAEDALAAARRGTVDVAFVDEALLGGAAGELSDRFADAAPRAAVVVMSSYAPELGSAGDDVEWLAKPCDAAALVAAAGPRGYVTAE